MNADQIIDQLQNLGGREVSPEEQEEIRLWENGRKLVGIVNFPGWDVILEMLKSYSQMETDTLLNTKPGSEDVAVNQAIAWAADRIYNRFVADANRAVEAAKSTPAALREGLKAVSEIPPDFV